MVSPDWFWWEGKATSSCKRLWSFFCCSLNINISFHCTSCPTVFLIWGWASQATWGTMWNGASSGNLAPVQSCFPFHLAMNFSRLFKVEPWNRWTLLQVRFYLLPFQPWTQHALSWCPQGTCYNPVCIPCPVLGTGLANKGIFTASHSFTHMFFFDEMIIYSFRNTVYCSTSDSEFLAVCVLSCILLFLTSWTVAHQASLSMGFPRHQY